MHEETETLFAPVRTYVPVEDYAESQANRNVISSLKAAGKNRLSMFPARIIQDMSGARRLALDAAQIN